MQGTALSSSDSGAPAAGGCISGGRIEKGYPASSGYPFLVFGGTYAAGARKVAVWTDAEIFFLVYVLAIILLCESAVGREARKYGLDMTYFHILVIFA